MAAILPLSEICTERKPNPQDQRWRILTLLRSDADIHATDKNGVTALHYAVLFRSSIAVQTLPEQGANVNDFCCKSGLTPLHREVTSTSAPGTAGKRDATLAIIRLRLASGADPNIFNKTGKTPLDDVTEEEVRGLLIARTA